MPAIEPHTDALELLAQASGLLARSFDLSATLPLVAELCVKRLADYCAIRSRAEDGSITIVDAARDRDFDFANAKSVLTSPLRSRGSTLGSFVLACAQAGAFDETTQKLAEIVALQLAGAIDQAALFDRTYRVADRLQRALLPDTFPAVSGAVFHAAYRPASSEAEVGGDWYDAFAMGDGRIAISMGDVAGHGLEAATMMGEVRQAMRSTSINEPSPANVLERVNKVINLRKAIGMVTAIFGYYEPQSRRLVYAVAGHPPPVLTVAGGFSGFLPGGGMPLGVEPELRCHECTITLPSRSCVVFYTDGMTEYGRDVIAGEARLLEASIRAFSEDSENPALALQERVFDAASNRDDAATLTLSCGEGPMPESLRFSALPMVAPIVRGLLHRFCDSLRLPETERFALITAAGEAVANSIEHAYRGEPPGEVVVRLHENGGSVNVEVEDYGRWRQFQQREERGRGLVLMHELMDHVRITSSQNRTVILLTLNRRQEAPAPH
jgi:anti-sigma regulatory factor (Ser/Thr protein kinase)